MTPQDSFENVLSQVRETALLEATRGLLEWDERTGLPVEAGSYRAAQITLLSGMILFLLTIVAMEAVAYAAHRWVMHGPGWFLHKSHHRPRDGSAAAGARLAAVLVNLMIFA